MPGALQGRAAKHRPRAVRECHWGLADPWCRPLLAGLGRRISRRGSYDGEEQVRLHVRPDCCKGVRLQLDRLHCILAGSALDVHCVLPVLSGSVTHTRVS